MTETEIDNLTDDDTTLLLHLAGELGDVERQTLEARLSREPALQARLDALASFVTRLRAEANLRPLTAGDSRQALNASLRLVREQSLLLQSRPNIRMNGRRLGGIPRWAWGSAVAACVAVGLVVWITNSEPAGLKSTAYGANMEDETGVGSRREAYAMASAFVPIEPANGDEGLAGEIDSQLDALNLLAVMNEAN